MLLSESDYQELKAKIKLELANVDSFQLKFSSPPQISTLSSVKPGAVRNFRRKKGSNYFLMGNSKTVVTAATVAQVVGAGNGELILPEAK